ncbi:TetR/AcrR family transcriptional regulator [Amycolatopsis orientalis]|uniref:TetR/AcrR family transcriptional regulator n=1 Tax=Amycolatopsis orientalis TaxID=31958 RepID=UPI00039D5A83|nr:TetR/AcrR family transcriptional regulator [Amycolatopsis orientalis]
MTGLRERKKQATRVALREAALRLAIEHGPANVRVDDIAEAAGVSPRTYNNYFSSREEAIVAAVTADRENRIATAVAERSPDTRLAEAVIDAVIEQYTDPGEQSRDALLLITTNPGLRTAFLDAPAALADPLQEALAPRVGDQRTARVLAASIAAAVRVALEQWTQPAGNNGLVVVSGSLPDLLRRSLEPLVPALDAAEAG